MWPQHELRCEASTKVRKPPNWKVHTAGAHPQHRVTIGFQGPVPRHEGAEPTELMPVSRRSPNRLSP